MTQINHKHVRDSRDRLIDLLGIGKTQPLRDLDVRDERLTVPFNAAAMIPIEISQPDVLYSLYNREDHPVERTPGTPAESYGNGNTLMLESPAILEDVSYRIRAKKFKPDRPTFLHQTATVKVGLDVSLQAVILNAELLDPTIESPPNAAPRIVDYGARIDIRLYASQEGVDYNLVALVAQNGAPEPEEVSLSDQVRGTRGDIELRSQAVYEDINIRIRATKTFEPAEGLQDRTDLLDVVLPIAVRANPANAVTVAPANIIDYRQGGSINIAASQSSARYRIYQRLIPDRDIIHGEVPDKDVVKVPMPNESNVQIRKPALPSIWQQPQGYLPVGEFKPGNGGELQLPLEDLTDDCLIIVQAVKEHRASADEHNTSVLPSSVPLQQPVVVLVRPDPAPEIGLRVAVEGSRTGDSMRVFNGQPGVFYYLSDSRDGKEIGSPAYFHKRDDRDDRFNKGLGQIKISVDFVVATDPFNNGADPAPDPATEAPQPPLIDIDPIALDANLEFRAVKAQTRVSAPLAQTASIPVGPRVTALNPIVDHGGATRIRIKASRVDEAYQLMQEGSAPGSVIKGNGKNRLLNTGPLTYDTRFELLVTRPDIPIVVVRVISVTIVVRPDPSLSVRPIEGVVDAGTDTRIRIEASQPSVQYQLMIGDTVSGNAVEGNGGPIELPTGPITVDTTFIVHAAKIDNTDISVQLDQQSQVTIRSGG